MKSVQSYSHFYDFRPRLESFYGSSLKKHTLKHTANSENQNATETDDQPFVLENAPTPPKHEKIRVVSEIQTQTDPFVCDINQFSDKNVSNPKSIGKLLFTLPLTVLPDSVESGEELETLMPTFTIVHFLSVS